VGQCFASGGSKCKAKEKIEPFCLNKINRFASINAND